MPLSVASAAQVTRPENAAERQDTPRDIVIGSISNPRSAHNGKESVHKLPHLRNSPPRLLMIGNNDDGKQLVLVVSQSGMGEKQRRCAQQSISSPKTTDRVPWANLGGRGRPLGSLQGTSPRWHNRHMHPAEDHDARSSSIPRSRPNTPIRPTAQVRQANGCRREYVRSAPPRRIHSQQNSRS